MRLFILLFYCLLLCLFFLGWLYGQARSEYEDVADAQVFSHAVYSHAGQYSLPYA